MSAEQKKIDRVAKAICRAVGSENTTKCKFCEMEHPQTCMWESFRKEAMAAIRAIKGL